MVNFTEAIEIVGVCFFSGMWQTVPSDKTPVSFQRHNS